MGDPSERADEQREAILVVDDDEDILALLRLALDTGGTRRVVTAGSAREAREALSATEFDVVVTDVSMPDEDGISLMRWARAHAPGPNWIVLTGHGTLGAAIRALQLGAFDFITKPLTELAPLKASLRNAIDFRRLVRERDHLHAELASSNESLRKHVEQLENAYGLLIDQAETLRADLRRAAVIQGALLPKEAPRLSGHHVQAVYRPSQTVGGDLYDVVPLDEYHVALLIADAAGHGLAAAMLAVLFRSRLPLVHAESGHPREPEEVLRIANESLCGQILAPGLFLTAAVGLLDTRSGVLRLASAGHLPLLVQRANGEFERLFHTGPALGLYPEAKFGQQAIELARGDRVLFATDGIYDCLESGVDSPDESIARLLRAVPENGPSLLGRAFGPYLPVSATDTGEDPAEGSPHQTDDITLMVLIAEPGDSQFDNGAIEVHDLPTPAPVKAAMELLAGSDDRGEVMSIQGRADWSQSAVFFDRCVQTMEKGRRVVLDLALCEHLDSTFLGTIHELAEHAERAGVELRLQCVMPPVLALFEELEMRAVGDHIVATALPMPRHMQRLERSGSDSRVLAQRTLAAHESLAALSDDNRREFDPLLAQLRWEVGQINPRSTG